jgi:hypothetical protein
MVKFNNLPRDKKIEPYYEIVISFTLCDDDDEDKIKIRVSTEEYEKYNGELSKFIIFMYICYYSSDNSIENENHYMNIKDICYFDENYECTGRPYWVFDEKITPSELCEYYDITNDQHKFNKFTYEHPKIPNHLIYSHGDYCYKFDDIHINYYDENNKKYYVAIEFSNDEIDQICKGIKNSHTLEYGYLENKFNYNDPDIFMKTRNLCIEKQKSEENRI